MPDYAKYTFHRVADDGSWKVSARRPSNLSIRFPDGGTLSLQGRRGPLLSAFLDWVQPHLRTELPDDFRAALADYEKAQSAACS